MPLPAWLAAIIAEPLPTICNVLPDTVATAVLELAKVTPRPEVDEPTREKSASPNDFAAGAVKEMDCEALFTVRA